MVRTIREIAFFGVLLLAGVVPGLRADEPGKPSKSSAVGDSTGTETGGQLPVDLTPYRQAFEMAKGTFWGDYSSDPAAFPDPAEGQPVVTAATFEPGVVVEITPDLKKLQAAGLTLENLRVACHYHRFSRGDWTLEVNGKRHNGAGSIGEITVVVDQQGKMVDLATLAAIRVGKMKPRTILVRMNDGRGLRVTPDVEKIGKYFITLDDFEYALWYLPRYVPGYTRAAERDHKGIGPLGVCSGGCGGGSFNAAEPERYLVLGGLRVPDSHVPQRQITYVMDGKRFAVHETGLGVPLESVARLEVVPARKIHGIVVDPFQDKPEKDFIVRAAGTIEAVQARVKADPILRPLSDAKLKASDRSLRSRVLGVPDNRYVALRAETSELWSDYHSPKDVNKADRLHGLLSIYVSEKPPEVEGMPAHTFTPPSGCWSGKTRFSVSGMPARVDVVTRTSDRGAHRRLINILMEESAKMGIPLKPKDGEPLVSSEGHPSQRPIPPPSSLHVRPSVAPRQQQPTQPGTQQHIPPGSTRLD